MIPSATTGGAPPVGVICTTSSGVTKWGSSSRTDGGKDPSGKKSKKRKIEKMSSASLKPVSPLVAFVSREVQIRAVGKKECVKATIFLTCERSYSRLDGGLDWNRLFTLRLQKSAHPVGDLSIDYRSTHLWVERVKNRQPTKYKGVGSALIEVAIRESFVQGKEGCVHLYSHGRTAGFYWKLGFTPLVKSLSIPRYPGLRELTEKLLVCKKRLSRITSSDPELWPIVAEAQKILAEEQARGGSSSVRIDGEYLLKEWFWSHAKQPLVEVETVALCQAFFENTPLIVDQQVYGPLPSEEILEGEMCLSKKMIGIWKKTLFPL